MNSVFETMIFGEEFGARGLTLRSHFMRPNKHLLESKDWLSSFAGSHWKSYKIPVIRPFARSIMDVLLVFRSLGSISTCKLITQLIVQLRLWRAFEMNFGIALATEKMFPDPLSKVPMVINFRGFKGHHYSEWLLIIRCNPLMTPQSAELDYVSHVCWLSF